MCIDFWMTILEGIEMHQHIEFAAYGGKPLAVIWYDTYNN